MNISLIVITIVIIDFRGRIPYTSMYEMLRNLEPPVGFGKKCPYRLAYRVSQNRINHKVTDFICGMMIKYFKVFFCIA